MSISKVSRVVKKLPVQHVVHYFKSFTVFEQYLEKGASSPSKVHLVWRSFLDSKDPNYTLDVTVFALSLNDF